MDSKKYITEALKTEPEKFTIEGHERLLHAGLGMATESGEFLDALKKVGSGTRDIDKVNLREELGDMLWYIALAMDVLETDFETEMDRNIRKLRSRHGDAFSAEKDNNRDLESEKTILSTK